MKQSKDLVKEEEIERKDINNTEADVNKTESAICQNLFKEFTSLNIKNEIINLLSLSETLKCFVFLVRDSRTTKYQEKQVFLKPLWLHRYLLKLIFLHFITFKNIAVQNHDQLHRMTWSYLGTGGRARGGHWKTKETKVSFCQCETTSFLSAC